MVVRWLFKNGGSLGCSMFSFSVRMCPRWWMFQVRQRHWAEISWVRRVILLEDGDNDVVLPQGWNNTHTKARLNNFTNTTADSTHRDKAHRSSGRCKWTVKNSRHWGKSTQIREPPHDICMERRIKRIRRPSSSRHVLAPQLKRILSPQPTDTMCLISSGPTLAEVCLTSLAAARGFTGKIGETRKNVGTPDNPMDLGCACDPATHHCVLHMLRNTPTSTTLAVCGEGTDAEKVHVAREW